MTIDSDALAAEVNGSCIGSKVRQVSRNITRVYDDALRPYGLTGAQFATLSYYLQNSGDTAVSFSMVNDIEKSTLSRNLKRLIALELIEVGPLAGRRGQPITLTEKGEAVFVEAHPAWRGAQRKAEELTSEAFRTQLQEYLFQDALAA